MSLYPTKEEENQISFQEVDATDRAILERVFPPWLKNSDALPVETAMAETGIKFKKRVSRGASGFVRRKRKGRNL